MVDTEPPTVVVAEPFATVPVELQHPDEPNRWAAEVLDLPSIGSFLEGPCFGGGEVLHVSDLAHGRILRFDSSGKYIDVLEVGAHPNGLAFHADGRLYVADYGRGILALSPGVDAPVPIATHYRFEPFRGVSDLVFAADGTLYFTDQGQSDLRYPTGRLFRWSGADGLDLVMDGIPSPNGLALSPDGRTLYMAVTRANSVYRIPLRRDGSIGRVGVFLHTAGGSGGPDGLAIDENGALAVAHFGTGRVLIVDPLGRTTTVITTPTGLGTTNVAYGGPDRRSLYITEADSGSVLRARVAVPGFALFADEHTSKGALNVHRTA